VDKVLMTYKNNEYRALSSLLLRQYTEIFLNNSNRVSPQNDLLNWLNLSRINRDLLALMIQARVEDKPHSYSELQELAHISRNTVKNAVRLAVEWGIADVTYDNTKAQIMATESVMSQYFDLIEAVIEEMSEAEKAALSNLLGE
jgi:succinate dehydrogenase flavin-adding protein (antitoxin of CptAB toxin-antitoxin module)